MTKENAVIGAKPDADLTPSAGERFVSTADDKLDIQPPPEGDTTADDYANTDWPDRKIGKPA
jgi:hypothetical protein